MTILLGILVSLMTVMIYAMAELIRKKGEDL